ncbi:Splicing factor 3B subunit 4 [Rhizophagus irregularis]|uniref:RRM domain-containing protein n=1 Tax=Rhizophagus irregularis TaxID=588596 RepID=A0A915ZEA2_9GLOM|nr:Splicing factor 3B subunit 4 [Rhizophagus irregularis]GBC16509.1 splicing factor 3B subunit 4 [Rhizophagus irregularis DAOM 181602=DAOM 197198]CAB4393738.1 unnamed protein product [Rhizophagus irregularis]CAB4494456.1 unnamed protein product [Rhizophagus irregularis]CAB5201628.1 unnamed protein product [Rhizophagus irregularis]
MNQIKLYGEPIRVNKATSDKKNLDVDASLFIRNLDPGVGEKMLYDTFSRFRCYRTDSQDYLDCMRSRYW